MGKLLPLVGLVAVFGCIGASGALAQGGFPLVCRGGGGMVGTVTTDGALRITFSPMEVGTATSPPGEGECGWVDRGFREGEPSLLLLQGSLGGIHFLIDAMLNSNTFTVIVFNDNQGSMVITQIGQ